MYRLYESDKKVSAGFARSRLGYSSSESLGEAIFGAATDGSKQTRYIVGDDAAAILGERAKVTDEQYVARVNERFGLGT